MIEKIEKYLIYTIGFLIPLVALPLFPNIFYTNQLIVLSVGSVLVLVVAALKVVSKGKLEIKTGSFDFPLLLLTIAYITSLIIVSPNKMEGLLHPGSASLVVFGVIYYFLVNQLSSRDKKNAFYFILVSSFLVFISSVLSISGFIKNIPNLPVYMYSRDFTLAGGNINALIFFGALLPASLGLAISEKNIVKKIIAGVALATSIMGIILNVYNILPGKDTAPKLLNYANSWAITVDTLKASPVLGIGPGNYITAFNRFRPISYNLTDQWGLKHSAARNLFFTSMTETGLFGAVGLILLSIVLFRLLQAEIKTNEESNWEKVENPQLFSLLILFILLIIFPSSPMLFALFAFFLAFNSKGKKYSLNLGAEGEYGKTNSFAAKSPAILVCLPIFAGALIFGIYGSKLVYGEYSYNNSLEALASNDGLKTYNLMSRAINVNPKVDRYHASFSQVNFALANNLAGKGEELTEEERNTITQLVQQTIEEAKAAVSLNPLRSDNWALLASTYRSVAAFAQGADQFAIQSYSQAVSLNPVDPNLRVALGGMYYAIGDYDNAIDAFKLAVITKPDLANARYNLAVAYREKGEIEKAIAEMTNVLSLVESGSNDYDIAKKELEALEEKRPVKEEEQLEGESIIPPAETEPVVEPLIDLPEDAKPPETEEVEDAVSDVSPTPEPTFIP